MKEPKPWNNSADINEDLQNCFHKITELKYKLMPYVNTQAAICSLKGLPVLKALFLNYPGDPTACMIKDQYLFGNDLLVAPMMEAGTTERLVYLPAGKWVDYQSAVVYEGERWHTITCGELPGILLVRWGALIPHIARAQSTAFMDWSNIEWIAYTDGQVPAKGAYYIAEEEKVYCIEAALFGESWEFVTPATPRSASGGESSAQPPNSAEQNFVVRSVFKKDS